MAHRNHLNTAPAAALQDPNITRPSLPFRWLTAVVTCLLVLLLVETNRAAGASHALPWAMALIAGAGVFVFSHLLLALLVVAIPPGLAILGIIGLTRL